MKLKLRPRILMRNAVKGDPSTLHSVYAIEVFQNRRWTLLGDENGPFTFSTTDERNAKIESLRTQEVEA